MSFDQPVFLEPPRKFQHRYGRHVVLFLLTLALTTYVGGAHYAGYLISQGRQLGPFNWGDWLLTGLTYSIPMLAILGAHEFGHYWYCRRHNVDASLPYFLPAPVPLTGTFGAVIRIKEPFPSKQALFDIGVAGPIAGFVVLVPLLFWGISMSAVVKFPPSADVIYFGEPLLLKAFARMIFGAIPEGFDLTLHPLGFAAWFGMFATALNLMPFGQLDGGHISYAVFGPKARIVSGLTLVGTLLLTFQSSSWISMSIIMLVMAFFLGLRHPHVPDEDMPLDGRRKLVAAFAFLMFVLCFTPVPIDIFFGK